jgi:hypothetical protein
LREAISEAEYVRSIAGSSGRESKKPLFTWQSQ